MRARLVDVVAAARRRAALRQSTGAGKEKTSEIPQSLPTADSPGAAAELSNEPEVILPQRGCACFLSAHHNREIVAAEAVAADVEHLAAPALAALGAVVADEGNRGAAPAAVEGAE